MKTIPLTQGQVALVDDEDFEKFDRVKWYAMFSKTSNSYYASRHGPRSDSPRKSILLHRAIMGEPTGMLVDHKNHDTLDCRKENLRVCTQIQNQRNRKGNQKNSTSKVLGVRRRKNCGRFEAMITVEGKLKYLGLFSDLENAIAARKDAEIKYFGSFAGAASC